MVKALVIFSAVVASALASPTPPHTLNIATATGGVEVFRSTRGLRVFGDVNTDVVADTDTHVGDKTTHDGDKHARDGNDAQYLGDQETDITSEETDSTATSNKKGDTTRTAGESEETKGHGNTYGNNMEGVSLLDWQY